MPNVNSRVARLKLETADKRTDRIIFHRDGTVTYYHPVRGEWVFKVEPDKVEPDARATMTPHVQKRLHVKAQERLAAATAP